MTPLFLVTGGAGFIEDKRLQASGPNVYLP